MSLRNGPALTSLPGFRFPSAAVGSWVNHVPFSCNSGRHILMAPQVLRMKCIKTRTALGTWPGMRQAQGKWPLLLFLLIV